MNTIKPLYTAVPALRTISRKPAYTMSAASMEKIVNSTKKLDVVNARLDKALENLKAAIAHANQLRRYY